MKKIDMKKIAMMGLTSGLLMSSQGLMANDVNQASGTNLAAGCGAPSTSKHGCGAPQSRGYTADNSNTGRSGCGAPQRNRGNTAERRSHGCGGAPQARGYTADTYTPDASSNSMNATRSDSSNFNNDVNNTNANLRDNANTNPLRGQQGNYDVQMQPQSGTTFPQQRANYTNTNSSTNPSSYNNYPNNSNYRTNSNYNTSNPSSYNGSESNYDTNSNYNPRSSSTQNPY